MSNSFDNLISNCYTACISGGVATAAEVEPMEWADLHVFKAGTGLVGGKNRGRLPFIELISDTSDYDYIVGGGDHGGRETARLVIRIWVGGTDRFAAETKANKIANTVLKSFKNHLFLNNRTEDKSKMTIGPIGYYMDLTISVTTVFNRDYGE